MNFISFRRLKSESCIMRKESISYKALKALSIEKLYYVAPIGGSILHFCCIKEQIRTLEEISRVVKLILSLQKFKECEENGHRKLYFLRKRCILSFDSWAKVKNQILQSVILQKWKFLLLLNTLQYGKNVEAKFWWNCIVSSIFFET